MQNYKKKWKNISFLAFFSNFADKYFCKLKEMKKLLILVCALTALASCQEPMEERAERDAQNLQKTCPRKLDKDGLQTLERVWFDKTTRVWNQDFLWNIPDDVNIDLAKMKELLLEDLNNQPSYQPYKDHEFKFHYIFRRMTNPTDTLINITLTKEDYQ